MDYGEIKALYIILIYKVLRSNNKPCSCSETSSVFIYIDGRSTTIRWRRSKAASLWRKKNPHPYNYKGLQIVYSLGNASGILYVCSIRVASNRKYDNMNYINKDLHSFQPPYNTNEKGGELK